jgi:hypothetical protein
MLRGSGTMNAAPDYIVVEFMILANVVILCLVLLSRTMVVSKKYISPLESPDSDEKEYFKKDVQDFMKPQCRQRVYLHVNEYDP